MTRTVRLWVPTCNVRLFHLFNHAHQLSVLVWNTYQVKTQVRLLLHVTKESLNVLKRKKCASDVFRLLMDKRLKAMLIATNYKNSFVLTKERVITNVQSLVLVTV